METVDKAFASTPRDNFLPQQMAGKMVIPVGSDILEIEKNPRGELDIQSYSGFAFVPLIKG